MNKANVQISLIGPQSLNGEVNISGAKNSALPCLAASILSNEELTLKNMPDVLDVKRMIYTLKTIGAEIDFSSGKICCQNLKSFQAINEEISQTRASILLLSPLLVRFRQAAIAYPGGCTIGSRKINFHLEALSKMGVDIRVSNELIFARAEKLKAIDYTFPQKSVTGTENIVMAAVCAQGTTRLKNCALEPEVGDLIALLKKMGAVIEVDDDGETLLISGKQELRGACHQIIADRIEAGTFLCLGALNDNNLTIKNASFEHLSALLEAFKQIGVNYRIKADQIQITGSKNLKPLKIATAPYPGFPTDLQAQLCVLLTQAQGTSEISETIFENRFQHLYELQKMGAIVTISGNRATISGSVTLTGARMKATDLRASAALVLAALIAHGESVISNYEQLMRGYENFETKLHSLGANVKILKECQ